MKKIKLLNFVYTNEQWTYNHKIFYGKILGNLPKENQKNTIIFIKSDKKIQKSIATFSYGIIDHRIFSIVKFIPTPWGMKILLK
jgi:hypothetical protein